MDTSKVTSLNASADRVKFNFVNGTEYTVRCTTVGINEEPDLNPRNFDETESEEKSNAINPVSQGNITLENVSSGAMTGGGSTYAYVSITLRNESSATETVTIDRARLNYFSGTSPGRFPTSGITHMVFTDSGSREFNVGGENQPLQNPPELNAGNTTIKLAFDGDVANDDFYVLTLEFSDGNVDTFFISYP